MKNNHGLLNELLQLYFCMCLNCDRKCSKWHWLPHWYLPRVFFVCILFHLFQLLINLTEGPNMMGFLPPQLPRMLFHYISIFHSSSFSTIIPLVTGFSYFFTLSTGYLHIPEVQRKSSSKILSLLCDIWALPFLPVCKKWFSRRASADVNC